MYCKHPEEACCNMTFYHGKIYCDNIEGFCYLHDELPPHTNADRIRNMSNNELADFLYDVDIRDGWFNLEAWKNWLKKEQWN